MSPGGESYLCCGPSIRIRSVAVGKATCPMAVGQHRPSGLSRSPELRKPGALNATRAPVEFPFSVSTPSVTLLSDMTTTPRGLPLTAQQYFYCVPRGHRLLSGVFAGLGES
jgi:hypothetical protein